MCFFLIFYTIKGKRIREKLRKFVSVLCDKAINVYNMQMYDTYIRQSEILMFNVLKYWQSCLKKNKKIKFNSHKSDLKYFSLNPKTEVRVASGQLQLIFSSTKKNLFKFSKTNFGIFLNNEFEFRIWNTQFFFKFFFKLFFLIMTSV